MAQQTDRKKLLTEIMEADAKDGLYETVTNGHKLTAVDWFYQRILAEDIKAVFEQAKAMEKEQIVNADLNATIRTAKGFNADVSVLRVKELAEQYYNETYQSRKD
jgi:hypothetical protein